MDYNPKINPTSKFNYSTFAIQVKGDTIVKWKAFSKLWRCYNENNPGNETQECNLNKVFANRSKEEEIFPLTTPEIAETQKVDSELKHCFRCNTVIDNRLEVRLIDDTYVVCKDGKMIIRKPLQRCAVLWYHQYLQHSGHPICFLKESIYIYKITGILDMNAFPPNVHNACRLRYSGDISQVSEKPGRNFTRVGETPTWKILSHHIEFYAMYTPSLNGRSFILRL
jgi:hypothetical protein